MEQRPRHEGTKCAHHIYLRYPDDIWPFSLYTFYLFTTEFSVFATYKLARSRTSRRAMPTWGAPASRTSEHRRPEFRTRFPSAPAALALVLSSSSSSSFTRGRQLPRSSLYRLSVWNAAWRASLEREKRKERGREERLEHPALLTKHPALLTDVSC